MLFKQAYQALQTKEDLSTEEVDSLLEHGEYLAELAQDFQMLKFMAY
ncbi:hypothetical protein [Streptococcus oriscaviae]|uniref:Uncharacterized protein n=1 Tax=Streptococcus oriscaviae TaxID=2781599 RepID=A0ABX7YN21_9STRE|nr:hypothetical protein [Streptococcus oriscaviae]QUE54624.1 hypothetical protein INT76_01660 [Streptococcus oriscaviae]